MLQTNQQMKKCIITHITRHNPAYFNQTVQIPNKSNKIINPAIYQPNCKMIYKKSPNQISIFFSQFHFNFQSFPSTWSDAKNQKFAEKCRKIAK